MNLLFSNDRRGEYPASVYVDQVTPLAPFAPLRGDATSDVVVVGAGYTGLSAALHLAEAGVRVTLLEAHRVGFGASGRNGGQIGSGQRLEVDDLERIAGRETAHALWNMAETAKTLTRSLAARSGVAVRGGVAHAFRNPAELDAARRHADHLARHYGYEKLTVMDGSAFADLVPSKVYCGGELDHGGGHLNPLGLALGMARLAADAGASIHEMSHVHHITYAKRPADKTIVQTGTGRIICDHVVLAANGYLGSLSDTVAARVMPINNFVIATEPLGSRASEVLGQQIAVHDTKFVVNYWRIDDETRLIFGGGENVSYRFPKDIASTVRRPLTQIYPALADVKFTHAWGGTLAITRSRLPCYARPAPNAYSASGFSGHGVALATLAGRHMAHAITGDDSDFRVMEDLPTPPFPGGQALRLPLLVAGMGWFALRDRLGR